MRMYIKTHLLPVILLAVMLAGCAGPRAFPIVEEIKANPGAGAYIPGVPVIEQRSKTCGPAALATVFAYYAAGSASAAPGMEEIAAAVDADDLGGSLLMDLFLYAKKAGYGAEYYRGSMDDLREKLSAGRPLILFIDFGRGPVRVGHYVVAVGYGDTTRAVILHTGADREEAMTFDRLERLWSRTGYSTLLVTPGAVAP